MAEAGLVYTGVGDAVRCYHCGGGLQDWEPGDNPWWEHARWYSECPHVILVKGQSFINKVANNESANDESDDEKNMMEFPAALSCTQMGYNKNLVQRVMKKYKEEKGHCNFKGTELAELCEKFKICDISNIAVGSVQNSTSSRSSSVASTSIIRIRIVYW